MRENKDKISSIDLHGIRHKQALELVHMTLKDFASAGNFSLTIITGNSSVLQDRIFNECLKSTNYTYFIPSWNMGQIVVEFVKL
tara:strand:- start:2834 stop:3085 length:252 start_codon:yes stop_codon:yes gene_type:complete